MWTRNFWIATLERALKSVAQAILIYLGGDGVFNAWSVDWSAAGGIAVSAAIISVLTSVISAGVNNKESPSLTKEA